MAENPVNLGRFKDLLLQERARLEQEMGKFHADLGKDGAGAGKRTELSTSDGSASLSEIEREMGYHDQLEGMLNEVNHALRRVEEQTYGLCELCREAINEARLEALPFAKLCIKCQERTEG